MGNSHTPSLLRKEHTEGSSQPRCLSWLCREARGSERLMSNKTPQPDIWASSGAPWGHFCPQHPCAVDLLGATTLCSSHSDLFQPYKMGNLPVSNRVGIWIQVPLLPKDHSILRSITSSHCRELQSESTVLYVKRSYILFPFNRHLFRPACPSCFHGVGLYSERIALRLPHLKRTTGCTAQGSFLSSEFQGPHPPGKKINWNHI